MFVVPSPEAKMFLEMRCPSLRDGRCHVNHPHLERPTTRY